MSRSIQQSPSHELAARRAPVVRPFDSVVIISPFYWNRSDDMWQTTHHVAREFSRICPTMFVQPFVQWNAFSEQFRAEQLWDSLVGGRGYSPMPNLTVFRRHGMPLGRFDAIRNFDVERNAKALARLLADLGTHRPLLWHSFPYTGEPFVEAVEPTLFAYHCLDHTTQVEENRLISRADAVFSVSDALVRRHQALNSHSYLMPNGVDLGLFNPERAAETPRPGDLPSRGRTIGFLGAINRHLDIGLLVNVARAFPNDSVVVIGRLMTSDTAPEPDQKNAFEVLKGLPNVRVLGFKPTAELPVYLHHFDVCLIPFLQNSFNQECDPLKFYQYAAMGKPVVSTPVSLTYRYPEDLYVGSNQAEFLDQVGVALEQSGNREVTQRMLRLAQTHSWERIVQKVCSTITDIAVSRGTPAC